MTTNSLSAASGRPIRTAGDRVRAFFETHPDPPSVDDLEGYRERWADPARRRASHHLFWPAVSSGTPRSILVAGCGIPVRIPDTVEVRDRIPTSAAAVPINRKHAYSDLCLPIDDQKEAWLG